MHTASQVLGQFVAETRWEDVDDVLCHSAKRSIANFVGCALAVVHDPAVVSALAVLQPVAGSGQATLIGRSERLDVLSAAFMNALAGNLLDYDDTHLRTVIHPAAPVVPVVLALAEYHKGSGRDVLRAFLTGGEVECRLGNAISPDHYARGWHITATCGVFGAAAAAASLLGLDAEASTHALGIAASQSAGVVENLPTGAKNVGVGAAARAGMAAALFAQQGFTAAPGAIDGPHGWAHANGSHFDQEVLLTGLGSDWEIAGNTYKPYPAGIVMHAVIDACLALRAKHDLAPEHVHSVTVSGDALLLARGDREVATARDAKVSIHHAVAAALLWGRAGIREFGQACVSAPEAVALRSLTHACLDAELPTGSARVEVTMADGRQLCETVVNARGSVQHPLSDADISHKVKDLTETGGSAVDADQLLEQLWTLDQFETLDSLMATLRCR